MSLALRSPLRYPGGKATLAEWIIGHMPRHEVYVEPFFGGGSVFFAKPRSTVEVVNDLDGDVANLFEMIRDRPAEIARAVELTPYARVEFELSYEAVEDPIERARRFCVRVWMAHGGKLGSRSGFRNGWAGGNAYDRRGGSANVWLGIPDRIRAAADRLAGVAVECRPALDVLAAWPYPDVLIYADPPYMPDALPGKLRARYYRHEMTTAEHVELLEALNAHPGPVLLSGYDTDLYRTELATWQRLERATKAYMNVDRTECLWLNPIAVDMTHQMRFHLPMEANS